MRCCERIMVECSELLRGSRLVSLWDRTSTASSSADHQLGFRSRWNTVEIVFHRFLGVLGVMAD
jgi:hypothetical protein